MLCCCVAAAQPHMACATHDLPAVHGAAEQYVQQQGLTDRVKVRFHSCAQLHAGQWYGHLRHATEECKSRHHTLSRCCSFAVTATVHKSPCSAALCANLAVPRCRSVLSVLCLVTSHRGLRPSGVAYFWRHTFNNIFHPSTSHTTSQALPACCLQVLDVDFFDDSPFPKHDVITMGMILHDWGLQKKKLLLRKVGVQPATTAYVHHLALILGMSTTCTARH